MLIRTPPGWLLPEAAATPEAVFFDRRAFLAGVAGLAIEGAIRPARAQDAPAGPYPAPRNERFVLDRGVTPEEISTAYNNFYEFGSHKRVAAGAAALATDPWTIRVDGLVERPFEIGVEELLRTMPLEERLYRHRCVEAWAMAVPWTGFALSALVERARRLVRRNMS